MSAFVMFVDISSGEEDQPEPVQQDEETRELRIVDANAFVGFISFFFFFSFIFSTF